MFSLSSFIVYIAGKSRLRPQGNRALFIPHNKSHTVPVQLLGMVRSFVPPLTYEFHKGMMGRIGIVGGCREYTGAPYYAAISALKLGCDLSYVFCTEGAATAIKSYSPELIVLPYLDSVSAGQEMENWIQRIHVLVIGPGLGREKKILGNTKDIVIQAKERGLPMVIDADGLHMITEDPSIIIGYKKAILTPNKVEFERLFEKIVGHKPHDTDLVGNVNTLSRKMGNVTILQKGEDDIISDGDNVVFHRSEGGC
ncbi:ATP-dependent (S)-NAD(P)H-hydrate dehydratase-like isoform X2 [Ostrea edulis]|uniref:ATP-dependent (S)-NAD(P)H-hydrate dehydratase-like isoform X2 n=1 Tax=Ostrea edulis TaxID=37623 RepID=UPI00209634EF|nr:ATP-dependent (S)-NAD(P)H-hydrate dehydratase-like isoform X2 [Ostrea edulis]